MATVVSGTILALNRDRKPSLSGSTIAEDLRPVRLVDAIDFQTVEGNQTIKGPFALYANCERLIKEGAKGEFTLFNPEPYGVFRDGSRPLSAILAAKTQDGTGDDNTALKAAITRVEKDLTMSIANKWLLTAMAIMLGVFLYDVYLVVSGAASSLNPEAALWGFIVPLFVGRTLWYRRRLKQLHTAAKTLA